MGRSDVNSTMTCIFRGQREKYSSRGPGLDGNEIDSVWPVGATKQSAPYKLSLTHTSVSRTIWSHVQFKFCLCSRNCL